MPSRALRPTAALLLIAACTAVPAAVVDVVVRERDGGAISGQGIVLHPPVAAGEFLAAIPPAKRPACATGADGRCTFENVPPGTYTVTLGSLADPNLVGPAENPMAPPPVFTVSKESDRLTIPVELWRGVLVTVQITVDRGALPGARCVFRSLENGRVSSARIGLTGYAEALLVPGAYEAALEVPAGFLITDLVLNRQSLPHDTALLDLASDPGKQSLAWALSAPCTIAGQLASDAGDACPLDVVATLLEPGPWYEAAVRRGGPRFDRVSARASLPNCLYAIRLPSGTWRVAPEGDALVRSEPSETRLTLAPGDDAQANFTVSLSQGPGRGAAIRVTVRAPDGRPMAGAVVEAWPLEGESAGAPSATGATSGPYQPALLRGLSGGDYRVVAGHADYVEGETTVRGFDPGAGRDTYVAVDLKAGARIEGRATDPKGVPVRDVEMSVERVGDPPPTRLASAEIAKRKAAATVRTDLTGHAEVKGLSEGRYRITPRMAGELEGTRFVLVAKEGSAPAPSLEAPLDEGGTLRVELPVRPAAALEGTVACADGGPLPSVASFRVFADERELPDPWKDPELVQGASLAKEAVPMTGGHLDGFRAGPLPPGSYRLAVRPGGFQYWTWAPTEMAPQEAAVLHAPEAALAAAGVVTADCGPLVMVVPAIRSREVPPDLREAVFTVTATTAGSTPRRLDPRVEVHEDRIFLRRIPAGPARVEVTLSSPYLIPTSVTVPAAELPLARGELRTVSVPFEAVGGSIEVSGEGEAARLRDASGAARIVALSDGRAAFPGLTPGRYRVETCADAACERVLRSWIDASVSARRTTALPAPSSPR